MAAVGTELFAITATELYADARVKRADPAKPCAELAALVACFAGNARE